MFECCLREYLESKLGLHPWRLIKAIGLSKLGALQGSKIVATQEHQEHYEEHPQEHPFDLNL